MSEFMQLQADSPATVQAVVEAVARLSTIGEAAILEMVSEGRLSELFPFRAKRTEDVPPDFVSEEELVEASPWALSREEQAAHIQSSMPSSGSTSKEKRTAIAAAKSFIHRKFLRSTEE
ncbi:MAG TPA: hypothetical protein VJQ59_08415 [Candidatus Sulfotelmatobacter sp.]|nr:hypothetical protein [Candidatus Sulfotelmatobacter sp.]